MADVTVDLTAFNEGPARFAAALDKTLRTWGFEVERRAKMKSPVDTGFNKSSIYTVTPDGKMFADKVEVAQRPGQTSGSSKKGKKYKPGMFAAQDPLDMSGAGYQDVLARYATPEYQAAQLVGGAVKDGPILPAPNTLVCEVRVGALYAIYLEMGTIKMKAQPFLGPAAAEVAPMLDSLMTKNLKAVGF